MGSFFVNKAPYATLFLLTRPLGRLEFGANRRLKGMHARTNTYWNHAPAKLNLFLELLERRPDGYHELETVMIAVSLFDTVWVTPNKFGDVSLHLESTRSVKPLRNEAYHRSETDSLRGASNRLTTIVAESEATILEQRSTSSTPGNPNADPNSKDSHGRLGSTDESQLDSRSANEGTGGIAFGHQSDTSHLDFAERSDEEIPTDRGNTVVRALEALQKAAGVSEGADVVLLKRIPSQAGLGGASSDAAVALCLANRAWGVNWKTDRLVEIAGSVGSDVPFFLSPGLARCWGRGEKMATIDANVLMHFVIVKPSVGLPTPEVFRRCSIPRIPVSSQSMIAALQAGRIREVAGCLQNRLQPAACQLTEWIERLAKEFGTLECQGHMMSGSGSSYFGVFAHRSQALQACRKLQARRLGSVYYVQSTRNCMPLRP